MRCQRLSSLLFLAAMATPVLSCNPPAQSEGPFVVGDDGPADPETLGYTINHFSLVSNNLTATQQFYGNVLGMRHLFTYQASEDYTVMYMGIPAGGKNGTGFQTGQQMYDEKNNREGLIEFLNVRNADSDPVPASTTVPNTFSHIGLIVPDLEAAQERMKRMGVKITKPIGKKPKFPGPIANAFGLMDTKKAQEALPGVLKMGFASFLVVEDPDGNLLEVQQQVSAAA